MISRSWKCRAGEVTPAAVYCCVMSNGWIILVVAALWWAIQAIVQAAAKKQEQQRLRELAEQRRQAAQRGGGGSSSTSQSTTSRGRQFGTSVPTSREELAARRQAQLEELRRRRQAQAGSRQPSRTSTTVRTGTAQTPPTRQMPSRPMPQPVVRQPVKRPTPTPQRPASAPQRRAAEPATALSRFESIAAKRTREKRLTTRGLPSRQKAATVSASSTRQIRAAMHDPKRLRELLVMKELIDPPLALRDERTASWSL